MGVNIGKEAHDLMVALRDNRDVGKLLEALQYRYQVEHLKAAASPPESRVDLTAYARGGYELCEALIAAFRNEVIAQQKPQRGKGLMTDA